MLARVSRSIYGRLARAKTCLGGDTISGWIQSRCSRPPGIDHRRADAAAAPSGPSPRSRAPGRARSRTPCSQAGLEIGDQRLQELLLRLIEVTTVGPHGMSPRTPSPVFVNCVVIAAAPLTGTAHLSAEFDPCHRTSSVFAEWSSTLPKSATAYTYGGVHAAVQGPHTFLPRPQFSGRSGSMSRPTRCNELHCAPRDRVARSHPAG